MFIFILKYTKGIDAIDKVLKEHNDFLDKYYKEGKFICSGRRKPRTGGVILCKAASFEEARLISEDDPFVPAEVAEYEIIEFEVSKFAEEFKTFIN
jgi:Uncharacterized protein conserved in bacteria